LVLRAGAGTGIARHARRHAQVRLGAGEGFGQVDLHGLADVAASARSPGGAAATAAHELAEHLVEDVAQAAAGREVEAGVEAAGTALLEGGVAVAVVGGPLLVVLQDVVRLADL